MARKPKTKKVLPKTLKGVSDRLPSVSEVLNLVETLTAVAQKYVSAMAAVTKWPPELPASIVRDGRMLAAAADFAATHVADEPVSKSGRLIIKRRDIDVVHLRRVLAALLMEESDLTPDERTANRLLAFVVHGTGRLTTEQKQRIRDFKNTVNTSGMRGGHPPNVVAGNFVGEVYGRSLGAQDAARAAAKRHEREPRRGEHDEETLLRFFVNWVLRSGRAPELASAIIETVTAYDASLLSRTTSVASLAMTKRAPKVGP